LKMQKILKILDDNNLLDDFNFRFIVSKQDSLISVLTQPVLKKGREPDKKELPIFVATGTIEEIEETLHEKVLEALNTSQTSVYKISEFAKQMEQSAKNKKAEAKKVNKEPTIRGKDIFFSKSDLKKKSDPAKEKEKTEPDNPVKKRTAKEILAEKKAKANIMHLSDNPNVEGTNPDNGIKALHAGENKSVANDPDQPTEKAKNTPPESKEEYGEEW